MEKSLFWELIMEFLPVDVIAEFITPFIIFHYWLSMSASL